MAFKLINLSALSNKTKRGVIPLIWQYWNEDEDTITEEGYFETLDLTAGDQILVINKDYKSNSWYNVTEAGQGKFTAVANTVTANN